MAIAEQSSINRSAPAGKPGCGAGGIGVSIDRLCMMLLGQDSIRDVILFPQLRPK